MTQKNSLTIATRASPLALQQASLIKNLLEKHHPGLAVTLLSMTTEGDKRLDRSLAKVGGKGLFVKELEEALIDGRADMAVHSMKDVPMVLPDRCAVPVITAREDVRDVFVANQAGSLATLPPGAVVGTSSLRRQIQLQRLRPDLKFQPLRGNIHTRLKHLDAGQFHAIILAAAGLKRMGLEARIRAFFSPQEVLPAAGQGALGIECRKDDQAVQALILPLNDGPTFTCVSAERSLCTVLGGGCQVPVAAYAFIEEEKLILHGFVADEKGRQCLKVKQMGHPNQAIELGQQAAEELIRQGARELLASFY